MKIRIQNIYGTWDEVKALALYTLNLKPVSIVNNDFKYLVLKDEHSPIRLRSFLIEISDIESFIIGHFVRHHVGVEKFVKSLRSDIKGTDDATITRETKNSFLLLSNIQGLINISRKRLCKGTAHPKTVKVWESVKQEIEKVDAEVASVMVVECIYRGFCTKRNKCCGYVNSDKFKTELTKYREL